MGKYIYEQTGWPSFQWDEALISTRLAAIRHRQGRLVGKMEALGFTLRQEAILSAITEDVLKSSEIEGELLDREQVRSSVARHLGMDIGGLAASDLNVEGVVEMMIDATQNFDLPLTEKRLRGWHAALFPTGHSGMKTITVGGWRDDSAEPMQVVSGPIGKERIHFVAPPAGTVGQEMGQFLKWLNSDPAIDHVTKAGIAHLWFVTIHPFDDGNGRIARAITDMELARSENSSQRFYSMSSQIRAERKDYYQMLETSQKGGLDISEWLMWFLACLERAFDGSEEILAIVIAKARFWETYSNQTFNDRQRKILNRVLDGFEGKLTSSKWAKLGKCSQDTASRDIADLISRGVLIKNPGGGRSTSYSLVGTD